MSASLRRTGQRLLTWYRRSARDLPWRRTRDPYRIWVSEIMLQQTRVEAVIPYYERFLERFPDVAALAAAPEADVLERWSGLGYYRRARFLHAAAKTVVAEHGGVFPRDYQEIRALSGVGDYTAAAIASIAFGLPQAALDGNVMRVLARLHNDSRDISRGPVRKALQGLVQEWMDAAKPGDWVDFNQAVMELGATVCTPRSPRCSECPLARDCAALREETVARLPYKGTKQRTEKVLLATAIVEQRKSLLMRRRPDDEEVMPGFWELPQATGHRALDELRELGVDPSVKIGAFKHAITYRAFEGSVYRAELAGPRPEEYRWVTRTRLAALPVSTITKKALRAAGLD